jgi:hypothetical protein
MQNIKLKGSSIKIVIKYVYIHVYLYVPGKKKQ